MKNHKDTFIFIVLTIIMIESTLKGINILTDHIMYLLLGIAGVISLGTILYQRIIKKQSASEAPYLNGINITAGNCVHCSVCIQYPACINFKQLAKFIKL